MSRVSNLITHYNLERDSAKKYFVKLQNLEIKELKSTEKINALNEKLKDFRDDVYKYRQRRDTINGAYERERNERIRLASIVEHYKKKTSSLYDTITIKNTNLHMKSDELLALKREKDNLMLELIEKRAELERKNKEMFSNAQRQLNLSEANRSRLIEIEEINKRLSTQVDELKKELSNSKETSEAEMSTLKEEINKKNFILNSLAEKNNGIFIVKVLV